MSNIVRTKDGKPISEEEFNGRNEAFLGNLLHGLMFSVEQFTLLDVLAPKGKDGEPVKQYNGKDMIQFVTALLNDASDAVIEKYGALDEPKAK